MEILSCSLSELETILIEMGQPRFRAKQLMGGYYHTLDISAISTIPKGLKDALLLKCINPPFVVEERVSAVDDTRKVLYKLWDGNVVEGVLMSYNHGNTLCVSTQVGCRMGCEFCASTKGGLIRNLSAGEILGQVLAVNCRYGDGNSRYVTNVVLMGSGEPLDNYDNVVKFLSLISSVDGVNMSVRNISLSTCGLCDEIRALANLNLGITLSVSLHSVIQSDREKLMPVAKKYSVTDVISAARYYFQKTGRRVIFEYAVCDGVNMSESIAKKVADAICGFPCHVNVILLNPIKESNLKSPSKKQAYRFVEDLMRAGVSATLRRQMGVDIDGACGQLRQGYLKNQ